MPFFSLHKIATLTILLFLNTLIIQAQTNSYALHKIKKGETLSTIAKASKTTVTELMHLNNLTGKSVLRLGKNIKIPLKQSKVPTPAEPQVIVTPTASLETTEKAPNYKEHIIKPKESFSSIARQNETTVSALMKLNGLNTRSVLKPGETIKIPINKEPDTTPPVETMSMLVTPDSSLVHSANYTMHVIKPKESLYSIAKENHTTIGTIIRLNGMKSKSNLKDGDSLKIPYKATVTTIEAPVTRLATNEANTPQQPAYSVHIIRQKETLHSLAKANHTTIVAIMQLNDMKTKRPLKRGESIKIPAKITPLAITNPSEVAAVPNTTHLETNNTEHIIKPNETLSSIAKTNHTTVGDIMRMNGMNSKSVLKEGSILKLPALGVKANNVPSTVLPNSGSMVKASDTINSIKAVVPMVVTTTRPIKYIVNKKDNLYKISKQFKTTEAQLKEWNGMSDNKIKPGMGLIVGQETVTGSPFISSKDSMLVSIQQKQRPSFPITTKLSKDSTRVVKDSIPLNVYKPRADSSFNNTTKNVHESIDKSQSLDIVDPAPIPKYAKYVDQEGFYAVYFDRKHLTDHPTIGDASAFKSTSGWDDKKYYILINDINQGAIVHVTYNDKSICAKVMGPLPPVKEDNGLVARISTAAAEALGVQELVKFEVTINY